MVVAKVVDQGLLSVPESELQNLGLKLGDEVAVEIKHPIGPTQELTREEKESILLRTRGAWSDIPDQIFDGIMNELRQGYEDWDRRLDASHSRHGNSH